MPQASLTGRIAALAGQGVRAARPLHGGDLSQVLQVTLADGQVIVAKAAPLAQVEARMLCALADAGAPVPGVIASAEGLVLMDYLPQAPLDARGWQDLAETLDTLRASTGPNYGWPEDYGFGPVAIPNTPCTDWPEFWATRRLMAAPEAIPMDVARRIELLAQRLPELLPARPPAALLHGDLWTGNLHPSGGRVHLIDPAAYYGDPEVDLAMLALFGRTPPILTRRHDARDTEAKTRRRVYQLWPALVHLRLFGGAYRGMVTRLLDSLGV